MLTNYENGATHHKLSKDYIKPEKIIKSRSSPANPHIAFYERARVAPCILLEPFKLQSMSICDYLSLKDFDEINIGSRDQKVIGLETWEGTSSAEVVTVLIWKEWATYTSGNGQAECAKEWTINAQMIEGLLKCKHCK